MSCVELLIQEGCDLDQRNVFGESPLIRASHNGHLYCVRALLDEGCDMNAVDSADNTALHWAAMRGHVEIVKLLVDRGADRFATNKQVGRSVGRWRRGMGE